MINTRRRMRQDGTADGPRRRSLTVATAPVPETERLRRTLVRLACDVHDGPMQDLAAAGYGIGELRRRLEGIPGIAPATLSDELGRILAELADAERGLRMLITRLERVDSAVDGIREIVETEVAEFAERCAATVDIEMQADIELDSRSQSHALRAVLHESLANVARHAGAHQVQVYLHGGAEGILLEVRDDGHGFEAADIRADAFGLNGMKRRVELLGGELNVLSRPGGPTVVTARLERWSPHAA